MDLAAPEREENAASLAGLRVAKQAELDAVVRQSADLGERVRGVITQSLISLCPYSTSVHRAGKAETDCLTRLCQGRG